MAEEIVILGGARTAMAEYVGTPGFGKFKDVSAMELGARAIEGAIAKTGVGKDEIDHVVMGNASQNSRYSIYGARHSGLYAGLAHTVPALTTLRMPITAMVKEAVGTAIGFARAPASAAAEPVKVVFEPSLVVRESTAPPGA